MVIIKENKLSGLTVFKSKDGKDCVYTKLQTVGLPDIKDLTLMQGKGLNEKMYIWLNLNWVSNTSLTRELVGIVLLVNNGQLKSLPVRNDTIKAAFSGVTRFITDNYDQLLHLCNVYYPGTTTLGGTPVPKISKEFNQMSFIERQRILTENRTNRLEENT